VNKSTAGAIGLVLLWVGFASLFVAFHPGGIEVNGHKARNPRDVILWFIQRVASGVPKDSGEQTV
jgi:hypothetical protein